MSTQEKIINAAKDLFAQKGYAAVRTKEIAVLAGVNETTLFRNFKSKHDLYESVLVSNIKSIDTNEVFHKELSGDIETDLLNVTHQLYILYKSNYQIIKMIMKGVIQDSESEHDLSESCRGKHIKKHLVKYFKNLNNENIIDDDPKLLSELYMSCMNGYLMSTFVLENKAADYEVLQSITKKIIKSINFTQ